MRDPQYNPAGVVLDSQRIDELNELLRSLDEGYKDVMSALDQAGKDEIERRIANGEYEQLPPGTTFRAGQGNWLHTRQDPALGRIGIRFNPGDVPAVGAAHADRKTFLEQAEHEIRSFFF